MSKVKFGLSNVKVAPRTESEGTVTYGKVVDIPGAVNLSIERESDQNIFYADNKAYFTTNSKSSVSLELEIAEIAKDIMLQYLGYVKSKNGTVLETNTAVTPSFALMFQIETDEKARKVCYYNCTAVESDEEYSTQEESIEPTTSKLTVTAIGEDVSDVVVFREIANSGDTNYGTFFNSVTIPTLADEATQSVKTSKTVAD